MLMAKDSLREELSGFPLKPDVFLRAKKKLAKAIKSHKYGAFSSKSRLGIGLCRAVRETWQDVCPPFLDDYHTFLKLTSYAAYHRAELSNNAYWWPRTRKGDKARMEALDRAYEKAIEYNAKLKALEKATKNLNGSNRR